MPTFDHVNVIVRDTERAIRFYTQTFGLTVLLHQPLSGEWFDAVRGTKGATADCVILVNEDRSLRIELLRFPDEDTEDRPRGLDAIGIGHFAVTVDDIEAVRDRAIRAGATPVGAIVEVPRSILPKGKRMCYLRDPDGILLELAQSLTAP